LIFKDEAIPCPRMILPSIILLIFVIECGRVSNPSIIMPSAFEPYLSKAIPLVNGIIDLGLALIKESIDFSLIFIGFPKICASLPFPSILDNFSEMILSKPLIILEVSMRALTPIASPPIARKLAYDENVPVFENKKRNAILKLTGVFKIIQALE
jgi:hypothetical protein